MAIFLWIGLCYIRDMRYIQDLFWYKDDYLRAGFLKKETPHYLFYFKNGSLAQKEINSIVKLKEEQYIKIIDWLGVDNNKKIGYYLYSSLEEKADLMGDNSPGNAIWEELDINNDGAVSQKFEIHALYSGKCKFINEHEDTHLLSLPLGLSVYLFCEGLAQYMENGFMGEDLHTVSKRLLKEGKTYSAEFIFNNKNWGGVSPIIIYPQVGSFTKFIIDKYGKDRFKKLYKNVSRNNHIDKNLKEIAIVYNKELNQIEREWISFLENYNITTS